MTPTTRHSKQTNLELRTLRDEDESSFRDAVRSFQDEIPPFQFAFEFDESEPFANYVEKLDAWSKGERLPDTFVPNSFLVGVSEGYIVGRVSIRHYLNDYLAHLGGHIGFGVVPQFRKRGYATEMLQMALPVCSSLGIDRLLITCDSTNQASMRTIKRCGGIFENETNDPELTVQKRRYWITLY